MSLYNKYKNELMKSNSPYTTIIEHAMLALNKEEKLQVLKNLKEKNISKKEEKVLIKFSKLKFENL